MPWGSTWLVILTSSLCSSTVPAVSQEIPASPLDSVPILGISSPAVSYTVEQIKQATENFSEANLLGRGGTSLVYRGQFENGELVAVKRFVRGEVRAARDFMAEAGILSCLNHRYFSLCL